MNIDREIAEKVMGWGAWVCETIYNGGVPWHPSTDIKQAFEVVEKMGESNFTFSFWNSDFIKGTYHCSFWSKDGCEISRTSSTNPAMAICLAALKAVEE